MIINALIAGLKSVAVKSLTSAEANRVTPLSMVFMGGVAGVCFILAEIFLGFSIYKILLFDGKHNEGFSLLMTAVMYAVQACACAVLIRYHLNKSTQENVIIKEYKLVKGVMNALIEGYKSK
jgi:hypothetical protein